MNEQDVQIIEKDGKPEYVVVPIEAYRRMVAALEETRHLAQARAVGASTWAQGKCLSVHQGDER